MLPVTRTKAPPVIRPVEMNCDAPISSSIAEPLPNTCHRMIICGKPGSGKSSLTAAMLLKRGPYHRAFDRVWAIIPPNSRASYKKDPFKNHNRVYDELTTDVLELVIRESKALAEDGGHGLLYVDDQAYQLKDKKIEKLLRQIFFNARHLHLSTWCVTQTLRQVPINLRKTASHLLTFEPANQLESKIIQDEFLLLDPKAASQLFSQVFTKRFDHLLIDTNTRRVFGNWNEVMLPRSF